MPTWLGNAFTSPESSSFSTTTQLFLTGTCFANEFSGAHLPNVQVIQILQPPTSEITSLSLMPLAVPVGLSLASRTESKADSLLIKTF